MSTVVFEFKSIAREAIPQALDKAERYRLLNDPEQAESICLDVLAVAPDDERALVTLVLAMTDQFPTGSGPSARAVREIVARFADPYQRAYYDGIISEREARALLVRGMGRGHAYDSFREAMELYQRAEQLRPLGNDDAVLRWNSCARTILRERLEPHADEPEYLLE